MICGFYIVKKVKNLEYSRQIGGNNRQGDNEFQVKVIAASDKINVY